MTRADDAICMQSSNLPTKDHFPEKEKLGLSAAVQTTSSPVAPRLMSPTLTLQVATKGSMLDPAASCYLMRHAMEDKRAPDPMLIEWRAHVRASPSRPPLALEASRCTPAVSPTLRVTRATPHRAVHRSGAESSPVCGCQPTPAPTPRSGSPVDHASTATRKLDAFTREVTKRTSTGLAPKPLQPKPAATAAAEPSKRSSARLANSKLAKIPTARRGEVLLMRRFEIDPADQAPHAADALNGVFHSGVPCGHADKAKDMFPLRRANMGSSPGGIIA